MAHIYGQPSTHLSVTMPPENSITEKPKNDLLMVVYGPEQPVTLCWYTAITLDAEIIQDPRNIIQLISHGTRDKPCIPDCVAEKFTLHQPFYVCLDPLPKISTCHSSKAHGRLKYAFPIPMYDCMQYKIKFGWASMLQVLQGDRSWNSDSTYPIALVGVECIDVIFHASGYLPQYIRIPLICKHRRGMTFYELAYSVSAGYRDIFTREAEKISPGRTAPMTPIVMNVNNLRLGSLYTDDPLKTRWWAEVVLIEAV